MIQTSRFGSLQLLYSASVKLFSDQGRVTESWRRSSAER